MATVLDTIPRVALAERSLFAEVIAAVRRRRSLTVGDAA
jgi:hypothetical protein